MPFTISHVVAILPLTTPRLAHWFVPAALVIGTMVPDVPLFAPYLGSYGWSHDLLIGPISYGLVVGMAVFALWTFGLRQPFVDLAPDGLRARLSPAHPVRGRAWLWAALSVVIGAYTHIVWDSFTHANRWGTRSVAVLNSMLGPLPGFKWLQYGCGIAGLVVLGWFLARWWRRTPPRPVPPRNCPPSFRRVAYFGVPAMIALVGVAAGTAALLAGRPFGGRLLITVGQAAWAAAAILVLSCCLYWWLSTERRRPGWVGSVPAGRESR